MRKSSDNETITVLGRDQRWAWSRVTGSPRHRLLEMQ